jgi:hypothetical protein
MAYCSAARKAEPGETTPALFGRIGDMHIFCFEILQSGGEIVAHEEELVMIILLRVVERGLSLGKSKDEPAVTGVDRRKFEHIAKKARSASGFFVLMTTCAPLIMAAIKPRNE